MSSKLSSMLSEIDTSVNPDMSKDSNNDDSTISQDTPRIFPVYICINEYSKRMDDELDMKPGDKIQVITDDEEYNDGWYFGRNLRTKEEGLYPVVFTQVISTERKPTFMRAKSIKRVSSLTGNSSHDLINSPMAGNGSSPRINPNASSPFSTNSNSNLPTPQIYDTSDIDPLVNPHGNNADDIAINDKINRHISVKSTMSDIDKALEEMSFEPTASLNIPGNSSVNDSTNQSITEEVAYYGTESLNVSERSNRTGTATTNATSNKSQSNNDLTQNKYSMAQNGKSLDPRNVKNWTPSEVSDYFLDCGFDVQSASRFKQHKISGKILLELELAHLKELDVSSFGTRFELYKEIESLRSQFQTLNQKNEPQLNTQSVPSAIHKELMPPAFVDQNTSHHVRKISQSMDDLPRDKIKPPFRNQRPASLMVNDQLAKDIQDGSIVLPISEDLDDENIFASPRRAPKPLSYPSPVQPPRSPLVGSNKLTSSPVQSSGLTYSPTSIYKNSKKDSNRFSNVSSNVPKSTFRNSLQIPKRETIALENEKQINKNDERSINDVTSSIYESSSMKSDFEGIGDNDDQIIINNNNNDNNGDKEDNGIKRDNSKNVKRNPSILSYFSRGNSDNSPQTKSNSSKNETSSSAKKNDSFVSSPFRQQFTENASRSTPSVSTPKSGSVTSKSPKKKKDKVRSVSAKDGTVPIDMSKKILDDEKKKRSVSEALKGKNLRTMTTRAPAKKQQTSAFVEGLRNVSVKEALKTADYSGWMSKKGSGTMSSWKTRFFTLEGTRLSYFANTTDNKERGLIDITGYRVVPVRDDDKFVSLFAATSGKGRYCFKLLPPQPGSKKGLTFTEPRIHYFAVDDKEEMRGWIANLIKTTIDIDTSVPVISSYTTPTVSLSKAKEMLAQAREETRRREERRKLNKDGDADGYYDDEGRKLWDEQHQENVIHSDDMKRKGNRTDAGSSSNTTVHDGTFSNSNTISTSGDTTVTSNGFASPYLLASGMLSPGAGQRNSVRTPSGKNKKSEEDYFNSDFTG